MMRRLVVGSCSCVGLGYIVWWVGVGVGFVFYSFRREDRFGGYGEFFGGGGGSL